MQESNNYAIHKLCFIVTNSFGYISLFTPISKRMRLHAQCTPVIIPILFLFITSCYQHINFIFILLRFFFDIPEGKASQEIVSSFLYCMYFLRWCKRFLIIVPLFSKKRIETPTMLIASSINLSKTILLILSRKHP